VSEEQINFHAAMRGPEKGLRRVDGLQYLLQSEAFPGRAYPWVAKETMPIGEIEEAVEES